MYALKPVGRKQTTTTSRSNKSPYFSKRNRSNQLLTIETWVKLAVNTGFIIAAIVTTTRLAMYQQSIETKLKELQITLEQAEERSQQAHQQFIENFDPAHAPIIQQRQSGYTDPTQKELVFTEEPSDLSPAGTPTDKKEIEIPSNSFITTP